MTAQQIVDKANEKFATFEIKEVMPALRNCNGGAIGDVLNREGCGYYQWTPGLIEVLKPKQIVELGAAMGVWDILVCHAKWQDFTLYAVTLPEQGLEFSFLAEEYPQLVKVLGDDRDLTVWPKDLDLYQTDLWFLDSEHTYAQLKAEIDLYKPYWKPGTVLLFDDIRMPQLWPLWHELASEHDSVELTDPLHFSGYGLIVW